ncbi:hypothetical protein RFI_03333 [Reticulomyxa filosa]|uniref:Nudix hydrolase 3 n=1 Tax=Reticulomyxa filosa TaxID=46433 RepID=X6P6Q5_RETFI|nr:hypothetical protein RFI_03333 [Reticulomyxa filosa]|eukprot:ETO33769.1 hypothetical protein RFI_03333 [Reticulomyxa filosa]
MQTEKTISADVDISKEEKKAESNVTREQYLRFFDINMGFWDHLSEHEHDRLDFPKPKGANFYPKDMTIEEWDKYVSSLKEDEQAEAKAYHAKSHINIFFPPKKKKKKKKKKKILMNLFKMYKKWLESASVLLGEAAEVLNKKDKYESLVKYLESRCKAFLSNDYIASDVDWLNIKEESLIDATIGPYEVYEDELLNQKAAFKSCICIRDAESSRKLQLFASKLQELENALPCADELKNPHIVEGKPIVVVDQVMFGGERGGPQTAAFNLPNDERVTTKYGNKLVILRNVQKAKFNKVLIPICELSLDPSQRTLVSFDSFFNHILCHEMCHSLGPHQLNQTKYGVSTVRAALGPNYSFIEEAKADIVGLWALLYLMKHGDFPNDKDNTQYKSVLITYLASMFRSIRFGLKEAHGKGTALQLNWIVEKGGFVVDKETGFFKVDFDKIESSVQSLANEVLTIQGTANRDKAEVLAKKYAINAPPTQKILDALLHKGVPVDIQPIYEWKVDGVVV